MLLEKKLYNSIVNLLGKDLSFCNDHSISLNLPDKNSPKKNYLFKDWHQEIWSGASPSTIQIWTPLIHKDSKNGQMELIEESHKWGHIPHMDRKPTLLPQKYKTTALNLEYGDVIIFSTLLLHRSLPTKSPRLSLPILLKNYKSKDNSYQDNRSFKIYSINGITDFNNIHNCTNKRDEINKKLSEKFREAIKTYHLNEVDFNFKSGRSISIACYDWPKDKNSLLVSLHSKEYVNRKPSKGIDSLHPLEFYMFIINSSK